MKVELPAPTPVYNGADIGFLLKDIALANLLCAVGLRGADSLAVNSYLRWLDEAAKCVQLHTERNYHKFLDAPGDFERSQAKFCIICMVAVLQKQWSVRYNPRWKGLTPDQPIPAAFGMDAGDLFIHSIIDGVGGTCGSLPVLYVAIGRRLGYPLKLVKAARHLFVRWDDPDGAVWFHPDRFNIEATGPGVHFLSDDYYRTWPAPLSDEDVDSGVFLRSLSQHEELAEFLATRGYCLQSNQRFTEAADALQQARDLAPRNRHFAESYRALRQWLTIQARGHAFLNAPVTSLHPRDACPFWIRGKSGRPALVQIVSSIQMLYGTLPDLGIVMMRQRVRVPNGKCADVWIPQPYTYPAMMPHWVRLSDGRYALVHQEISSWPGSATARHHNNLQRISSPHNGSSLNRIGDDFHTDAIPELPLHEQGMLRSKIELGNGGCETASSMQIGLPMLSPLALPAGPGMPNVR